MKGNIHTDWAISMGIFLVAILTLFIFLKPGVQPIYKETVLLDIIEQEFLSNTTWTVKQLPLFITTLTDNTNNDPKINLIMRNWLYSSCKTTSGTTGILTATCTGNTAIIDCMPGEDCKRGNALLIFYPNAATPKNIQEPELDETFCKDDNGAITDTARCDIQLGSTEDVQGINNAWLQALKNLPTNGGYEQLKRDWKFPLQKNFALYQVDNQGNENFILGGDTFNQKNVFVRELTYWILSTTGDRTPITISFRVW